MSDKSHDNIDHMHDIIVSIQQQLERLAELGRSEFGTENLGGYHPQMVDAFSRAMIQAGHGVAQIHAMIDQDFQAITQEDVIEAFRKRLGREHGEHVKQGAIPQEPFTVGQISLADMPDFDAPAFDPRSTEHTEPRGRHSAPEGGDTL